MGATAALADAVAMERIADQDHSAEENNNPLSQFDAQMAILEGRLLQAQYLASKASSQTIMCTANNSPEESSTTSKLFTVDNNNSVSNNNTNIPATAQVAAEKPKLRRPFPVP